MHKQPAIEVVYLQTGTLLLQARVCNCILAGLPEVTIYWEPTYNNLAS